MDIREIRKDNATKLLNRAGSSKKFALMTNVSPQYVSQVFGPKATRAIGDKYARAIEEGFNLDHGWLDRQHSQSEFDVGETSLIYGVPKPMHDYSFIRQYDNALAAGHSAINEFDNPKDALAFKSEWLKRKGLCPDNLVIVYATGDSMEPVIREKDVLMIDTSQKAIIDGKIYGFTSGDGARVKQLFQKTGGGLKVCSLNKAHYDEDLTAEEAASINIIGRVVWCGGEI